MQDLNWNDLRFVLAVARCQSLAGAARRLGVNESTVGRRVARAEQDLGARLFERSAGAYHPTDAGAAVVACAERVELDVQGVENAVSGTDDLAAGTVRVTSVPVLVNHVLVPALPRLLDRHPQLRVELIAEPRDMSLTKREADIALRLARPEKEVRAVARRIGQLDYAVYGPSRKRMGKLPWITYDDGMADLPQHKWLADQISREDADQPPLAVNDAESLLHSVRAGLGKSLLPVVIAGRDRDLARLHGDEVPVSRELWLMVHPELRHLVRIRVVMEWLASVAAALSPQKH